MRRSIIGGLLGLAGLGGSKAEAAENITFPPVPKWRPTFRQPLDRLVDRISYYTNGERDFAMFRNGTGVILEPGLTEDEARASALDVLGKIFHAHPDMNPSPMDDGNILVGYNHPAVNVVLSDVAQMHWPEIKSRHLDGLTASEVLITPLGPNKFDDLGKQALLGRAFFFMDAQDPEVVVIQRRA